MKNDKNSFNPYKLSSVFYDGKWQKATSNDTLTVISPANETETGSLVKASEEDTLQAIASAKHGLKIWSNLSPWERGNYLHKVAEIMKIHNEDAAHCLAKDIGKPLAEGRREWTMATEQFYWFGNLASNLGGFLAYGRVPNSQYQIDYEPIGVVGAFTAWNFPPLLASRKIAPALAAGCSIILRPSDEAPSAIILLIECCRQAGIPDGVVNCVIGDIKSTYQPIMQSKDVAKITLTGSTNVGKQMIVDSAKTIKKLSMELGGNAPVIIFDDADAKNIAIMAAGAKHANAGQVCASPDRFFVHSSVYDSFIDSYSETVKKIIVGDTFEDESVTMGPIVNKKRLLAIDEVVQKTAKQGGEIISGGNIIDKKGYYYAPTIFVNSQDHHLATCNENFGPISSILKFDEEDEVYQRANNSDFGLASYVFTKDASRARRAVKNLDVGMVAVNSFALASAEMPFGGVKQSGYGREGGMHTLIDYCSIKTVHHVFES